VVENKKPLTYKESIMRKLLLFSALGLILILGSSTVSLAAPTEDLVTHDSSQPLHVAADNLVVLQENSRAVFTGNVVASQGEMVLKSDKMTVFYRNAQERKAGQNAIARVDVAGNVLLTTPKEKASGNQGYYDVDGSTVKLMGDVVLSQGETVIRGQDLVYNVKTRQSSIQSAKAPQGQVKQGKDGRVEMYIPNVEALDKDKNKKKL
jgi:lipopolysaccharide export system protein LptA